MTALPDYREVKEKAAAYCAARDRSAFDVSEKLAGWQVPGYHISDILAELTNLGFINDRRFAVSFATSKFHSSHWGKEKIRRALSDHHIENQEIESAICEINQEEYLNYITTFISKELHKRKTGIEFNKDDEREACFGGIVRKLVSRGFEEELVKEIIHQSEKSTTNK